MALTLPSFSAWSSVSAGECKLLLVEVAGLGAFISVPWLSMSHFFAAFPVMILGLISFSTRSLAHVRAVERNTAF